MFTDQQIHAANPANTSSSDEAHLVESLEINVTLIAELFRDLRKKMDEPFTDAYVLHFYKNLQIAISEVKKSLAALEQSLKRALEKDRMDEAEREQKIQNTFAIINSLAAATSSKALETVEKNLPSSSEPPLKKPRL